MLDRSTMDDIHIAPYSRELGRVRGEAPGATLIAVGGVHGNEPAGLEAGRRVLARLRGARLRGEPCSISDSLKTPMCKTATASR